MTPSTNKYLCDLYFLDRNGQVKGGNWVHNIHHVEWANFINNGFVLRIKLHDSHFDLLTHIIDQDYLTETRAVHQPNLVRFRLRWENGFSTPWRTAAISDMDARGLEQYSGHFEFIAVDPISYFLNRGDTAGSHWWGQVGGNDGVIMQVLRHYVPDTIGDQYVVTEVDETTEVPSNYWMMRQDPRTFIMSLLDWSSSLTKRRTSWVVCNGEEEESVSIRIRENYTPNLKPPTGIEGSDGPMLFHYGPNNRNIYSWSMVHDPYTVVMNSMLTTSGISAISGEYLDIRTDTRKEAVWVTDLNTSNKVNPSFGADRGFAKPLDDIKSGFTSIMAIPEFNAGDVGRRYRDYVDGRARQSYINMLNMIMRIKIRVRGEPRMFNSEDLGKSFVTLKWLGVEKDDKQTSFMDGNWLLYGWHHKQSLSNWITDVYLCRLDYNARAIPGGGK